MFRYIYTTTHFTQDKNYIKIRTKLGIVKTISCYKTLANMRVEILDRVEGGKILSKVS